MTQVASWLEQFYQGDNIKPGKCLEGNYPPAFQRLLEPLIRPASEGVWPIILPASSEQGIWFYATAEDENSLKALRSSLRSALGSADTYGDLPVSYPPVSQAGRALYQHSGTGVIEFTLLQQGDTASRDRVFETLALIQQLYQQKPALSSVFRRPDGRVLRDFMVASQQEDGAGAADYLQELRENGGLSSRNLLTLELMALAANHDWQGILSHQRLPELISGALPLRLVRLLLRAMGHHCLQPLLESGGFTEQPVGPVRAQVQVLQTLFCRVLSLPSEPEFQRDWQLWALGVALCGRIELLARVPDIVDAHWLEQLRRWGGIENTVADTPTPAERPAPDSFKHAALLIGQTLAASDEELDEILQQLDQMPETVLEQVRNSERLYRCWQACRPERQSDAGGWTGWFNDVIAHDDGKQSQGLVLQLLDQTEQWGRASFDEQVVLKLLSAGLSDLQRDLLRQTLPAMCEWLAERDIRVTTGFWLEWLNLLSLDDMVNIQDLCLADRICQQLLSQGYEASVWKDLCEHLELIWEKVESVAAFPAALDLLDTLASFAPAQSTELADFWCNLQCFALRKWARLAESDRLMVRTFCTELTGECLQDLLPPELQAKSVAETTGSVNLDGRLLAIYSLMEGAARRARDTLQQQFPELRIELNHDHVDTSALKHLARTADYFLFADSCSKHQAYFAVKAQRKHLLYAAGKGASSLVRAFLQELSADQGGN